MAMFYDNRRQDPPSEQNKNDQIRQEIWDRGQSLAVPGDNGWQGSLWSTQHQIISHVQARLYELEPEIGIPDSRLDNDLRFRALRLKYLEILMANDDKTRDIILQSLRDG